MEENPWVTNFVERVRLDLGELVLHVVWVHGADLLAGGGPQHLDDLHKLINARLSREQRLTKHQLSHDAAGGPDICYEIVSERCCH